MSSRWWCCPDRADPVRVAVGKPIRVGPGDEVVVQARLPAASGLGRLFVFAREDRGNDFSPYVPCADELAYGQPKMLSPLSLRLTRQAPGRLLQFRVDIDGFIQLMQEVDALDEPVAKVRLRRRINSDLDWKKRIARRISGLLPW
jgi:hypothetical protein